MRAQRPRSFWPTATQRALLQVALGPVEDAAACWDGLQPLDVTALPPGSFPLLPLLYERLAEVAPDEPQLRRLLGTYRRTWYRNRLLFRRLGLLHDALRERGVECLLAGGASALLRWYPTAGSRPVGELDLFVEPGHLAEAVAAAEEVGWARRASARDPRLVDADEFALVLFDGAPPAVAGPLGRDGGYRSLRAEAAELPEADGGYLVLDPADELLVLCATGARRVLPPSLQWLVDVFRLLESGALPPVEAVIARAHQFRIVEPLRETVACLSEALGAGPVAKLVVALHAQPPVRRERLAFRLAAAGSPRLVAPAQLLAGHLHATAGQPRFRTFTGFPSHLRETWGAPRGREVTLLAARKTARLVRGSRSQVPSVGRNRSASS